MEYNYPAAIYVTIMSAHDIRNVNWFSEMDVYAKVFIEGLSKKSTCVAKGCGTNPKWEYNRLELKSDDPIRNRSLVVQLMSKRYRWPTDKIIGSVTVPIKDLLHPFSNPMRLFKVCTKSGKTQGWLQLYYVFGKQPLETDDHAEPEYQTERTTVYEPLESKYSTNYNDDHMSAEADDYVDFSVRVDPSGADITLAVQQASRVLLFS